MTKCHVTKCHMTKCHVMKCHMAKCHVWSAKRRKGIWWEDIELTFTEPTVQFTDLEWRGYTIMRAIVMSRPICESVSRSLAIFIQAVLVLAITLSLSSLTSFDWYCLRDHGLCRRIKDLFLLLWLTLIIFQLFVTSFFFFNNLIISNLRYFSKGKNWGTFTRAIDVYSEVVQCQTTLV